MTSTITSLKEILEESLGQSPIGETDNFIWLTTPLGIAALNKNSTVVNPSYEIAINEAREISMDLSREEKEFHQTEKGILLVFYS